MKPIFVLDNGHGVETPGKRSPKWKDGTQLFEYEFNRNIVNRIAKGLSLLAIDYKILVPETIDISLSERVRRANKIQNGILISVHANAGGGSGFEIYTSPGKTQSDDIATIFCQEAEKAFPEFKMRFDKSDGDLDKEADFYVLSKSNCPAILTENLFMDNEQDCKFLMTENGRQRIADYHINSIIKIWNNSK
jgi:N-acetylmuramoyl-L-alanine amidase